MAILKDRTAINILKRARSSDLEYNIQTFPEEERDGKTDLEILRDEMDYLISMYEEEGTIYSNDLEEAREILRDIDNAPTIYPAGRYDSKRANQILEKIEEIAREAFSSPVTGDINLYRSQKLADIFAIFEYDGATIGLDPSSKSEETEDGQMDIYEAIAEAEKEED